MNNYIKKRWQEYTEELYKKDFHDPDNHDGVITDLEPDILECLLGGRARCACRFTGRECQAVVPSQKRVR